MGAYFEADKLSVPCPSILPSRSATSVLPSILFLSRRMVAEENIARLSTTCVVRKEEGRVESGAGGAQATRVSRPCSEKSTYSSCYLNPQVPRNLAAGQSLLAEGAFE